MKHILSRLFITILFLGICTVSASGQAEGSSLVVQVSGGIGGYCRPGYWTPLWLTVENQGAALHSVTASLPDTREKLQFDLPANARKHFEVYVQPEYSYGSSNVVLEYDKGKKTTAFLKMECISPEDMMVAAWSKSAALATLFSASNETNTTVVPVTVPRDGLPENAIGYRALNILLIGADVDTRTLNEAQVTAIQEWVRNGGDLIVVGGGNWTYALGLADTLPFTPQGTYQAQEITSPDGSVMAGDFTLVKGAPRPNAHLLAGTSVRPLVLVQAYGLGRVLYTTFDPLTLASEDRLAFFRNLWHWSMVADKMPQLVHYTNDVDSPDNEASAAYNVLHNLPNTVLARPSTIGLLALIYALLVGPVQLFVLRRRRIWLWRSTLLIIVGFCGLMAFTSGRLRYNSLVNQYYIIHSWPESPTARVDGISGFLNTNIRSPLLETESHWQITPLESARWDSQPDFTIQYTPNAVKITDVKHSSGEMLHFLVSGEIPAPRYQAALRLEDHNGNLALRGNFTWGEAFPLTDVRLITRGIVTFNLEDIQPGENTLQTMHLQDVPLTPYSALGTFKTTPSPTQILATRTPRFTPYAILNFEDSGDFSGRILGKVWDTLTDAYPPLPADHALLLGWADVRDVPQMLPHWKEHQAAPPSYGKVLFMFTLPITYGDIPMPLDMKIKWVSSTLEPMEQNAFFGTLPVLPPQNAPVSITLHITMPGGNPPPAAQIWNYRTNTFEDAPPGWPVTWEDGRDYISPEGFCLFRINADDSGYIDIKNLIATIHVEPAP